ncbi:Mov34/MPN/PAD-1 family protein [Kamptonema formosum]|uniref:Mov34/MPN/PAD-1 family protein n=1 Tax=Kamptonema formosum TaxID=331992 RepID=UPI0003472C77|nr:Mov34/MPN/PAD-1 family protein [Oscillatoria sp. PCC 10802]
MARGPGLPDFPGGNNPIRRTPGSEQENQIIWGEECEDVYKPILKSIREFIAERGISNEVRPVREVYIKEDALANLKSHLASNLRVEQGGILLGNAYRDTQNGIYVEITASVAAPATIGTGAHLEFTPDSWQGIMDYARAAHPQENIVGWYHSHPSIGVFMSGTDMNTQRAFFYHPWCLSIVCDPVRKQIGYFLGKEAVSVNPFILRRVPESGLPGYPEPQDMSRTDYITNMSLPQGFPTSKIDWIENPDSKTEGATDATPKNPITRRSPETSSRQFILPAAILFVLLGAIIFIQLRILFPAAISSQSAPAFSVRYMSMPARVLSQFKDNPDILRYKIVKAGDKIGTGDEVTLLVISPAGQEKVDDVQLEVEQVVPTQDVGVENYVKIKEESLTETNSTKQLQLVRLDSLNPGEGVLVPVFSSKMSSSPASQDSEQATQPKRVVREIVYIPRRLLYKDSSQKQQEMDLKYVLKNASKSK